MVQKRCLLLAAVLALFFLAVSTDPKISFAADDLFDVSLLDGQWKGRGTMHLVLGFVEDFNCKADSAISGDGTFLTQELKCKSDSYSLDTTIEISIVGSEVTGSWSDRVFEMDGRVRGKITSAGLVLMLSGEYFDAKMVLKHSDCRIAATVTPIPAEIITQLSARLTKKC